MTFGVPGHIVDAFSINRGVDYGGGDLMRIKNVKSAQACRDICCNIDRFQMMTVKPTAYTWLDDNYNCGSGAPDQCYCKNFELTHPNKLDHAESGKCPP